MNIASIDIGTNTVLLLIAEVDEINNNIKPLLNEYKIPRIGKGLTTGNKISEERVKALYNVLDYYSELIKKERCDVILSVGTNAFRLASNGQEIASEIKKRWDIDVKIITGIEEARLSFLGATYHSKFIENVVIDIGGGSTEIVYGNAKEILFNHSFQIGSVSLTERFIINDPPDQKEISKIKNEIEEIIYPIIKKIPEGIHTIAVAGTPTSLAGIKQGLSFYDEFKVDNFILSAGDLEEFIKYFAGKTSTELLIENPIFLAGREDVILAGTIILYELMRFLNINSLTISSRGIRYGLVAEYIQKYLK